jgi:shikimate dehydrogenase
MHTAALAELGLGEEWRYEAIDVAPDRFEEQVRAMAAGDFSGANVTVPHKSAALAVADSVSEDCRQIGAANTLIFGGEEIEAANTDAAGFLAALPDSPVGKHALVLGAGGAARAIVWALLYEGAEVDVWNRTELRSRHLCEEIGGDPVTEPDPAAYGLIVNTTAVGLGGEDPFAELPLTQAGLTGEQTVVDLVYGNEPTALARAAGDAGATVVDGIEVLVQQGARSLRIWTGLEPPLDAMRAAARR